MACGGMNFTKILKFEFKNFIFIYYIWFFHVITAPWTLRGSRILQGLALIRVVFFIDLPQSCLKKERNMAASITSNHNRNQNMIFQKFICGCKECLSRCEVAHDAKTYGQIDGHGQKKNI